MVLICGEDHPEVALIDVSYSKSNILDFLCKKGFFI